MTDRSQSIQNALDSLKERFADSRTNVFDVQAAHIDGQVVALAGKVLDEDTRAALRKKLGEALPGTSIDDSAVQVLRRAEPRMLSVATNLTSLHTSTSFHTEMSTQLLFGWPLELLETKEERWGFVRQSDGYLGWAYLPYLSEQPAPQPTHLVIEPVSRLLAEPDPGSEVITRVMGGTAVCVGSTQDGWGNVAANKEGWLPLDHLRSLGDVPATPDAQRETMVRDGMRLTGTPYLWGGCTANGIDCSGLSQLLHRWVGITIPRDADMQYFAGKPVEPPYRPGDLLFYHETDNPQHISHVSISLGGWTILHSSRSRNGVYTDDVQSVEHLRRNFYGACSYLQD